MIFETTDELLFYLVDGDLRKFEGVLVNCTDTGLEDELGLIFNNVSSKDKITTKELQHINEKR